ncbi:YfjI family protein [uncultured Thiodictyon sp.]|uniref:YfjI family protein n=1 Tax=uncultured Thiodictyon sp. TaxID=1846217 RepID=UPI0025FC5E36|nr:YfjI family protein [uncultured Thiodictyon sp.]
MSAATPRKRPRSLLPIADHLQDGLSAKVAALEVAGRAATREEMKRQRTQTTEPARSAPTAAPWPAPEPLPSGLPAVAPFALDLLPAALRPWVADIAERMQCPPDYPAVSAMVTLAAVVGRQMAIRPKCQDDWTVTPNLWGAVVGRPSLLKTPAIQEAIRMIDALEANARQVFDHENTNYEAALLVHKETSKEAIKRVSKAVQAKDAARAHSIALEAVQEPPPPVRKRYKTHDATVEKLGDLLRENPRGMLLYRDELIGFLKSLDQDGREGSRAFYLEAWNGTGGFTFDRMGRGTVEIAGACVSIIGGIQPGPIGDYMVSAIRGGIGDDGLVQRFQLAVWPDATRDWHNVDRWPDTAARDTARAVYERLDCIDPDALHATREDGDALPWVRFDEAAQREFNAWREVLEHRLRDDDLHPCLESHLAKFRSLVPSLALLCHLADVPEGGPVGLASAQRAMAWVEYLETHARRIYAPAMAVDMAAALELDRRMQSLPAPFTARDIYRKGWRFLDLKGTSDALAVLVEFGRIRADDGEAQGRPTTRYTVHPSLVEDQT